MEIAVHRLRIDAAVKQVNEGTDDVQRAEFFQGPLSREAYISDVGRMRAWGRLALECTKALPHIPGLALERMRERPDDA